MTTSSSTEIQQLKDFIQDGFKELKDNINQLDNKIGQVRDDIKNDIKGLDDRLRAIEIGQAEAKGRMDEWKTAIQKIPDLAEKVGELKNWRQTAFVIIAAVISAFLGWIARGARI